MLDLVLLALGLGLFVLSVGYAHACEPTLRGVAMTFDYSLAALVTAANKRY
jgi:hypothetical protein